MRAQTKGTIVCTLAQSLKAQSESKNCSQKPSFWNNHTLVVRAVGLKHTDGGKGGIKRHLLTEANDLLVDLNITGADVADFWQKKVAN